MMSSSKLVKSFKEDGIPPIPGFENDNSVRTLMALHIEKTIYSPNAKEFDKAAEQIFEDFGIQDPQIKKLILNKLVEYNSFLQVLIAKLHTSAKETASQQGRFEYPTEGNIYYDDEDELWRVDLDNLQEAEAKYDNLNLLDGRVVFIFNPTKLKKKMIVDNSDMDIRAADPGDPFGMGTMMQQMMGTIPDDEDDDDEDGEKESAPDYEHWDKLMAKCQDRDVVLIYEDGEEVKRF